MVLCGPETRDYLINYARSLIYTTALGFPFLASIRAAYELLSSGETESVSRSPLHTLNIPTTNWVTVTTPASGVDPPSPTTARWPPYISISHVRSRPFPHISHYLPSHIAATATGESLPGKRIHCSSDYATDDSRGKGTGARLYACRKHRGGDRWFDANHPVVARSKS